MATTTPSTALVPVAPVFTNTEQLALAGFLAGCTGLTRQAYELDLRQFASWCQQHQLQLFGARRADIELFARDLEARGRARATITRRLCTVAGFFRYAVEEELLDHSPAAHVRRPRLDYESHAIGLDRNELGALLVAAGLGPPAEHALISLLALNRLRVSEAAGADIESLGTERGHRTLVITRKGGKIVTIPLAPRTARAIDLAIGERAEGPIFLAPDGRRLDRHGAGRAVRALLAGAAAGREQRCCVSHRRVGTQHAVQHFVPPRATAPAVPAQNAFPAEPGSVQCLLLGDIAGLGRCLDPVHSGMREQVAHQQSVRLCAVAVATGLGKQPDAQRPAMGSRRGLAPPPAHRAKHVVAADHHQRSAVLADETVVLPAPLKQPGGIPAVLLELTGGVAVLRQRAQQRQVILADRPQRHPLGHDQIMPRPCGMRSLRKRSVQQPGDSLPTAIVPRAMIERSAR
jgi:integrase/recombinase XerD